MLIISTIDSMDNLPGYFTELFDVINLGTEKQKEEAIARPKSEIIFDEELQAYYLPSNENNKIQIKPEQTNLLEYMAKGCDHSLNMILCKVYYITGVPESGTLSKEQRQRFDTDKNQINKTFKGLGIDELIMKNKKLKKTYYLSRKIKFPDITLNEKLNKKLKY